MHSTKDPVASYDACAAEARMAGRHVRGRMRPFLARTKNGPPTPTCAVLRALGGASRIEALEDTGWRRAHHIVHPHFKTRQGPAQRLPKQTVSAQPAGSVLALQQVLACLGSAMLRPCRSAHVHAAPGGRSTCATGLCSLPWSKLKPQPDSSPTTPAHAPTTPACSAG